MRSRWSAIAVVTVLVALAPATDAAARPPGSTGSSGLGDRFFPLAGNGGYDVGHYDLELAFDPASGELKGEATLDAVATQRLDRFDIDLRGFTVDRVTVNERQARFTRDGQELVVTPGRPVGRGDNLEIVVRYHGVPETVIDPDGALDGWIPTHDGAIALSEP